MHTARTPRKSNTRIPVTRSLAHLAPTPHTHIFTLCTHTLRRNDVARKQPDGMVPVGAVGHVFKHRNHQHDLALGHNRLEPHAVAKHLPPAPVAVHPHDAALRRRLGLDLLAHNRLHRVDQRRPVDGPLHHRQRPALDLCLREARQPLQRTVDLEYHPRLARRAHRRRLLAPAMRRLRPQGHLRPPQVQPLGNRRVDVLGGGVATIFAVAARRCLAPLAAAPAALAAPAVAQRPALAVGAPPPLAHAQGAQQPAPPQAPPRHLLDEDRRQNLLAAPQHLGHVEPQRQRAVLLPRPVPPRHEASLLELPQQPRLDKLHRVPVGIHNHVAKPLV
mmetsp:Transcript_41562/g.81205  ORF Transcript_41562/g.81205 Transcript_41562/m.81205 type:complete len:332 (-) Transcript_41562:4712-5707(-)